MHCCQPFANPLCISRIANSIAALAARAADDTYRNGYLYFRPSESNVSRYYAANTCSISGL